MYDKYCCLGVECVVNKRATRKKLKGKRMPDDLGLTAIPDWIAMELADMNDGFTLDGKHVPPVPWEIIAGMCIVPWDGRN